MRAPRPHRFMRSATRPLRRMTLSRCLDVGGLALRWALLLFLVFDQMATPFQGHGHDADMAGSALAQTRPDDARINLDAACLPEFRLVGMRPSAPARPHPALFVAAASDDEDQTPWLNARLYLALVRVARRKRSGQSLPVRRPAIPAHAHRQHTATHARATATGLSPRFLFRRVATRRVRPSLPCVNAVCVDSSRMPQYATAAAAVCAASQMSVQ